MKYFTLAIATLVATALAYSIDAMKIADSAVADSGNNLSLKGCGDDCNSDSDCDSSCPNCFLGACFYFSKDNATDHKILEENHAITAEEDVLEDKELGCISNICGYCQVGCFCDWDGVCRSPLEIAERVAREEEEGKSKEEEEAPQEKCVSTGGACNDCECDCCSGFCACDENFGCTCEEFRSEVEPKEEEGPEEKCVSTGESCYDCECDCCSGLCACDDNFGCTCEEFRSEEETKLAAKAIHDNATLTAGNDLYCNYGDCSTSGECEGNFCSCFFFECGCADGSPGTVCGRSGAAEEKTDGVDRSGSCGSYCDGSWDCTDPECPHCYFNAYQGPACR